MRLFYYCILLFSLVTLGGCINDADPVDDPSGNPSVVVTDGNVMFSFTVPETSSSLGRASAESSDETVPGSENESRIEKVQLYLFHSETKNFIESSAFGVFTTTFKLATARLAIINGREASVVPFS